MKYWIVNLAFTLLYGFVIGFLAWSLHDAWHNGPTQLGVRVACMAVGWHLYDVWKGRP